MANPTSKSDEDRWIDDRIRALEPPPGWKPDTDRAFEGLLGQRQAASKTSRSRLSFAGVGLIVIGLVLLILPWGVFRTSESIENREVAVPQQPRESQEVPTVRRIQTPPPILIDPITETAESPPTPVAGRSEIDGLASLGGIQNPTAEAKPASSQGPESPQPEGTVTDPVLVSHVYPAYTREAREARIQGTVELLCLIRTDGTVAVESVRKSLGYGLDESARAAVEQWRFVPGKKDGVPVNTYRTFSLSFSLR